MYRLRCTCYKFATLANTSKSNFLCSVNKDLLELAALSGAVRVISKHVTFAEAVLTVLFFFFCKPLNETIANRYFLSPFYCSGQLIYCLEISGNKNNLRTIWGWNRQKIKNSPESARSRKVTGSYIQRFFLIERARTKWNDRLLSCSDIQDGRLRPSFYIVLSPHRTQLFWLGAVKARWKLDV